MSGLAYIAAALVVAWAALVITAQVQNPDQSPLSMGMSGLARGRSPWVMKSSFIVRGLSALALVAAMPGALRVEGGFLVAAVLLWVWGLGSAVLALADTDMPGEPPTSAGAAHAIIALVAYVAGASGAIILSVAMLHGSVLTGLAVWALPISVTAAAALVVQFVAFGAQAREARSVAPARAVPAPAVELPAPAVELPAPAVELPAPAVELPPAPPPLAAGVPPQLGAAAPRTVAAVTLARFARPARPDRPDQARQARQARRLGRPPARSGQLRRPLPAHLRRAPHGLDAPRRPGHRAVTPRLHGVPYGAGYVSWSFGH